MIEAKTKSALQHQLSWLDQLAFELYRATGRCQLMQGIWIYDREVDLAALTRMNERFATFSFNRLIEPSPLPWGRPRWVKPAARPVPLEIATDILPASQLLSWANHKAHTPIDPVNGPAWRMAFQRFDDGRSAVSVMGSHLLLDGMGTLQAIEAATQGVNHPGAYETQGCRGQWAGWLADTRQFLSDTPQSLAALARIAKSFWSSSARVTRARFQRPIVDDTATDDIIHLPTVQLSIDVHAWDQCAERLGGSAFTLFPAFVATLAAHLGRRRASDGAVSLLLPINRRHGLDDERALAIDFHALTVNPEGLTENLSPMHDPVRSLLRNAKQEKHNALDQLLPVLAWMPQTLAAAIVDRLFSYGDSRPVSCSDVGALPNGLARIDGESCQDLWVRAVDVNVTRRDLERSHGHLVVVASRFGGKVSLGIEAYQLSPSLTSTQELHEVTVRTLEAFGLNGVLHR